MFCYNIVRCSDAPQKQSPSVHPPWNILLLEEVEISAKGKVLASVETVLHQRHVIVYGDALATSFGDLWWGGTRLSKGSRVIATSIGRLLLFEGVPVGRDPILPNFLHAVLRPVPVVNGPQAPLMNMETNYRTFIQIKERNSIYKGTSETIWNHVPHENLGFT